MSRGQPTRLSVFYIVGRSVSTGSCTGSRSYLPCTMSHNYIPTFRVGVYPRSVLHYPTSVSVKVCTAPQFDVEYDNKEFQDLNREIFSEVFLAEGGVQLDFCLRSSTSALM